MDIETADKHSKRPVKARARIGKRPSCKLMELCAMQLINIDHGAYNHWRAVFPQPKDKSMRKTPSQGTDGLQGETQTAPIQLQLEPAVKATFKKRQKSDR